MLVTGIALSALIFDHSATLVNRELEMYEELVTLEGGDERAILQRQGKKSRYTRIVDKICARLQIPGIYTRTGRLDFAGNEIK